MQSIAPAELGDRKAGLVSDMQSCKQLKVKKTRNVQAFSLFSLSPLFPGKEKEKRTHLSSFSSSLQHGHLSNVCENAIYLDQLTQQFKFLKSAVQKHLGMQEVCCSPTVRMKMWEQHYCPLSAH